MPTVRDTAIVTGDLSSRHRRRRTKPTELVLPVHAVQVHPLVWAEAMRRTGGDASMLRVVDATTVEVVRSSRR